MMRAAGDASETSGSHRHQTAPDKGGRPLQVVVEPAEQHSAWLGGSIISCGTPLEWITKAHYDVEGPMLVHLRCCS
jgi:actin-related protein